eukprot:9305901-Pyramimonas_sp.AAC.1
MEEEFVTTTVLVGAEDHRELLEKLLKRRRELLGEVSRQSPSHPVTQSVGWSVGRASVGRS